MARMKRLQISIEPELDDALAREARQQGVSKAALIRRWVAERVRPFPPIEQDPLWQLVGIAGPDVEPVEDIDTVIYGPIERSE
jgi:hypothetical protein